ncbi:MAG: DUF6370 family protein, partial [Myxococcota bacterium]
SAARLPSGLDVPYHGSDGVLRTTWLQDVPGALRSAGSDGKNSRNSDRRSGCASCIYEMEGVAGCQLAVKIDGKPYLVTGADVNAHGAGLCASAKKAKVAGKIEGDKFVATSFVLQQ